MREKAMFDLIASGSRHPFHDSTPLPALISIGGHIVAVGVLVGLPLLYATNHLPVVPTMMAFVAAAPAPEPPPPPPPPAPPKAKQPETPAKPAPAVSPASAPVEAPAEISPEPPLQFSPRGGEGGFEGGLEGGSIGGIVGGLAAAPPPPPPPPPPATPAPRTPVRIGGALKAPVLMKRVEPIYPDFAVQAKAFGVVILEATVDEHGRVEAVRVLRSIKVLDQAAVDALKQWQYEPLILNGIPTPFVLTVTFNFGLQPRS
jgi:protein TonB